MADRHAFLALGDSYTVGESVPMAESWPYRLADRLTGMGLPTDVTVIAATGWTAAELLTAVAARPPETAFDLVALSVGVNDQYRGIELPVYRASLLSLVRWTGRLLRSGRAGRFAVSIPDWGVTPFASDCDRTAVAGEIDRFNQAFRSVVTAAGMPFVDVTGLSRRPGAEVAEDGLHPAGGEYGRWVDEILPVALGLVGGKV